MNVPARECSIAVRLYAASGEDWTKRLLGFAQAFRWLSVRSAVLDGLIVVPDAGHPPYCHPDLTALQWVRDTDLIFFAFDPLHHDGNDLKVRTLPERKRRLARLIARSKLSCLHLVDTSGDGADLLRHCEAIGLHGVVSKLPTDPGGAGTGLPLRDTA